MDKDQLKKLRGLWDVDAVWLPFEEYLKREHESALNQIVKASDERAVGKLVLIRQLLKLRDYAKEMMRNEPI